MENKGTINDEIQKIINNTLQQQPTPTLCTITKIYEDQKHIDAETNIGTFKYAPTIGNPIKNHTGIIIFLNQNYDEYIIIC
jgi:hypothetical protein